ncbi:MAG: threonine synthase [Williamsia sp.]|nr:threonine synthase [Williamsia sp.]
MKYFSTNQQSPLADFREATIRGQAPDKGLYFPEQIPLLPKGFFDNFGFRSREEIAFEVIKPYVGDTIPSNRLQEIVRDTISFDFPLVKINEQIAALELFHGPTLAFKDVGARFMSRCLAHFVKDNTQKVTVLVATSGDTGGAVAGGFYGVEGVDVVILYPAGKVSSVQELQLTTWGGNIAALEVAGNFDDCQRMVKQAFADEELTNQLFLTSANSINVARWLPQQFYYFFAYQQWPDKDHPPVISVPSGNFGNICAGMLAQVSGLPVQQFIAACNANDTVPAYLASGSYTPKTAVATLSNAMDVGDPSNFSRILEIFQQQFSSLKKALTSSSVSDSQTRETIRAVYEKVHYLLDPHGAVAYRALEDYLQHHAEQKGYLLGTAHPVKFYDVVEPVINQPISLPDPVQALMGRNKHRSQIAPAYSLLKEFLLAKKR